MTHIVGKLDGFLRKVADHRDEMANGTDSHTNLQQRIMDVRKGSLPEQGRVVSEASL